MQEGNALNIISKMWNYSQRLYQDKYKPEVFVCQNSEGEDFAFLSFIFLDFSKLVDNFTTF